MSLVHRSRESDRRAEIEVSVYLSRVNFLSEFGFNSDTHTIVTLFTSIEFRNGVLDLRKAIFIEFGEDNRDRWYGKYVSCNFLDCNFSYLSEVLGLTSFLPTMRLLLEKEDTITTSKLLVISGPCGIGKSLLVNSILDLFFGRSLGDVKTSIYVEASFDYDDDPNELVECLDMMVEEVVDENDKCIIICSSSSDLSKSINYSNPLVSFCHLNELSAKEIDNLLPYLLLFVAHYNILGDHSTPYLFY